MSGHRKNSSSATHTVTGAGTSQISARRAKGPNGRSRFEGATNAPYHAVGKDHIEIPLDAGEAKIGKLPVAVGHVFGAVTLPGINGHATNGSDVGFVHAPALGGTYEPYGPKPSDDFACWNYGAPAIHLAKVAGRLGQTEFGAAHRDQHYILDSLRGGLSAPSAATMMCFWSDLIEQVEQSALTRTYYVPLNLLTAPPQNDSSDLSNSWLVPLSPRHGLSFEFTLSALGDLVLRGKSTTRVQVKATGAGLVETDVKVKLFAQIFVINRQEFAAYEGAAGVIPYATFHHVSGALPDDAGTAIGLRSNADISSMFLQIYKKTDRTTHGLHFYGCGSNGEQAVKDLIFEVNFHPRWRLTGDEACGPVPYAMGCNPQLKNPIYVLSEATSLNNINQHNGEAMSASMFENKDLFIVLKDGLTRSDFGYRLTYACASELKVSRGGIDIDWPLF